jgi:hypothetical protein
MAEIRVYEQCTALAVFSKRQFVVDEGRQTANPHPKCLASCLRQVSKFDPHQGSRSPGEKATSDAIALGREIGVDSVWVDDLSKSPMDFRVFWIYLTSGDLQQRVPDFGANGNSSRIGLFI